MMNKKLLTVAVAAALAVPAVASAEAILYGKLNVSVDYIDVEQNATFYRPGQAALAPRFSLATFNAGSVTTNTVVSTRATLGDLYPTRNTNTFANPQNYNPWNPNAAVNANAPTTPTYNSALPGVVNGAGLGTQVWTNLTAAQQAAYNKAAQQFLGGAYPRNDLVGAEQAGWNAVASGYGVYGDLSDADANNNWPLTVQIANATAAGKSAYTAAKTANKTEAEAQQAASLAYDAAAAAYWNELQKNLNSATEAAFGTEGSKVGATNLGGYFAEQQARLTNDLRVGNISQDTFNQQTVRIANLQRIAYGAAATGAFSRGKAYKGWGMDTSNAVNGPASRLGVKGSEDLGNGLKAVYQIELAVDITNANRDTNLVNGNRGTMATDSGFAFRNTFIGLAGDWGTFLLGRHDTPLKISTAKLDLFADSLADNNATVGFQDLRVDNAVAYISPSWSGFLLAAAVVPQNGATSLGAIDQNADSVAGAYSLAAIYKNGPFYGSVAYEALDQSNFETQNVDYALLYQDRTAKSDTKVRVGLGLLDWNGFSLTGIYEQRQNILGAPMQSNGNFFQVQAGYAFGNNMVKAMWGRADLDKCADPTGVGFRYTCQASALGQYFADTMLVDNKEKSSWALGYDYNFSKRTAAYVLYTQVTDKIEDADWSGFSIGMNHSF